MNMFQDTLVIAALTSAMLSIGFLVASMWSLKNKKRGSLVLHMVSFLLMLSLFALFGTISIATRGYLALTAETLAAVVDIEPLEKQRFIARFRHVHHHGQTPDP